MDKQPSITEDPDEQGGSLTVAPSITFQVQAADQKQFGVTVQIFIFQPQFVGALQVAVNENRKYKQGLHSQLAISKKPTATAKSTNTSSARTRSPEPTSQFKSKRFAGQATLEACGREQHRMLVGESDHDAVTRIQQTLVEAGYTIKVGGLYGPDTEKAVAKFKREHSPIVPSDGVVGPGTSHALDEIAASRGE